MKPVKIPKRVNTAWDWAEKHIMILATIAMLAVAAGTVLILPAVAALVVGIFIGAVVVQRRMKRRVRRLRAELDDLLRENGALRHQKTVLASGVIAAEAQPTATLPVIREAASDTEPRKERPSGTSSDQETMRLEILPEDLPE